MLGKVTFLFAVALVAGGMAWGQGYGNGPGNGNDNGYEPDRLPPRLGHIGRVNLGAVPRLSIEARNSAGLFRSDVDNFIDPRFHNRDLDTFLFVGANVPAYSRQIHAGFAWNFDTLYLAMYFGGGLVDGFGEREREGFDEPDERYREAIWKSNMALLLGVGEAMGFRFDVTINNETTRWSREGPMGQGVLVNDLYQIRTLGPSFALTWGALMDTWRGDIAPWVRIGYRAPSLYLISEERSSPFGTESRSSRLRTNAALELSGGARFELGDISAIGGEIWFGNTLPDRLDRSYSSPVLLPPNYDVTDRRGGMTGFGLGLFSSHIFDFGMDIVRLGFSPNMNFGISTVSYSWEGDTGSFRTFGERLTTLDMGVDLGITWQATERIALFAGAEVQVFDWTTGALTGERYVSGFPNEDARHSVWNFEGVRVDGPAIGVTFSPVEEVVVGLSVNGLLNRFLGHDRPTPTFDFTVGAMIDR